MESNQMDHIKSIINNNNNMECSHQCSVAKDKEFNGPTGGFSACGQIIPPVFRTVRSSIGNNRIRCQRPEKNKINQVLESLQKLQSQAELIRKAGLSGEIAMLTSRRTPEASSLAENPLTNSERENVRAIGRDLRMIADEFSAPSPWLFLTVANISQK